MKTKMFIPVLFTCLLCVQLSAQVRPAIVSQHAYGSANYSFFKTMKLTSDNGLIIGGYSYKTGLDKTELSRGKADYWVIKTDSSGNIQWDKTLGTVNGDLLADVIPTKDGGYLVGGNTNGKISGDKTGASRGQDDIWIVKLDSNGNIQWDKTIGGSGIEEMRAMDTTSDGGFIIGSNSDSPVSGDKTTGNVGEVDYWIIKLDAWGNIEWDKTFGSTGTEYLNDIKQTKDKGYITGGGLGLLKLDIKGNEEWNTPNSSGTYIDKVLQLPNGKYIAGGSSTKLDSNRAGPNYWLLYTNKKGHKLYEKVLGGNGNDFFGSMTFTSDQGLLVAGSSDSYISGDKNEGSYGESDYWVVRLNVNAEIVWQKTVGGIGDDNAYSVLEYKKNFFFLGGSSNSGISGNRTVAPRGLTDYWTVKLKYPDLYSPPSAESVIPLANIPAKSFTAYPNPATTVLHVRASGKQILLLINQEGKTVLSKMISGSGDVNVANLSRGSYYLQNAITGAVQKILLE